jgi:acyl-coenzyme A thioesterase PaaI-like protein
MIVGLPDDSRSIVTGFSIEYLKKARGPLSAECSVHPVDAATEREHSIQSVVRDSAGDVVARATARWLVGPREDHSQSPAAAVRGDVATRSGTA